MRDGDGMNALFMLAAGSGPKPTLRPLHDHEGDPGHPGAQLRALTLPTDHGCADQRIALAAATIGWLETQARAWRAPKQAVCARRSFDAPVAAALRCRGIEIDCRPRIPCPGFGRHNNHDSETA